jgi:hypothetical protein
VRNLLHAVVNDDEIIARAIHFPEFHGVLPAKQLSLLPLL